MPTTIPHHCFLLILSLKRTTPVIADKITLAPFTTGKKNTLGITPDRYILNIFAKATHIPVILKDRGYKISVNTVADIIHENGLFAVGTGAKKLYQITQERKLNILNQQFNVSNPNEVWVSDITYFRYNDRTFYICVILDLFARRVVGYRVSLNNSTQLTKSTFKTAYEYR